MAHVHGKRRRISEVRVGPRAVATKPAILAQNHLGPRRIVDGPSGQSISCTEEEPVAGQVDVRGRLRMLERKPRPIGIVLRRQLQRLLIESGRVRECVEGDGSAACVPQRDSGATCQLAVVEADRACELESADVVMGKQLGRILGAHQRLDPRRLPPVPFHSHGSRNLPVRNVADENVPERVLLFSLN